MQLDELAAAGGSPEAAVEDQDYVLASAVVVQGYGFAGGVG